MHVQPHFDHHLVDDRRAEVLAAVRDARLTRAHRGRRPGIRQRRASG